MAPIKWIRKVVYEYIKEKWYIKSLRSIWRDTRTHHQTISNALKWLEHNNYIQSLWEWKYRIQNEDLHTELFILKRTIKELEEEIKTLKWSRKHEI